MNAITHLQEVPSPEQVSADDNGLNVLCRFSHDLDDYRYFVELEADIDQVSLEGMNHYLISVTRSGGKTGLQESLVAALEINLREEMNSISIDTGQPYYFTVSRRSMDLYDEQIDSSIQEVVDLGLVQQRLNADARGAGKDFAYSILFDYFASDLIKASASALLAQSTLCHGEVLRNAGGLFANRQDYVREMCHCIRKHAENLSNAVVNKALYCSQGLA